MAGPGSLHPVSDQVVFDPEGFGDPGEVVLAELLQADALGAGRVIDPKGRTPELDPSPLGDFGSFAKMAEAETGRMLKKPETEAVYWGG